MNRLPPETAVPLVRRPVLSPMPLAALAELPTRSIPAVSRSLPVFKRLFGIRNQPLFSLPIDPRKQESPEFSVQLEAWGCGGNDLYGPQHPGYKKTGGPIARTAGLLLGLVGIGN